jgi:hypothetical protein
VARCPVKECDGLTQGVDGPMILRLGVVPLAEA